MIDIEKTLDRLDRCMTYLVGDPDILEDKGVVHTLQEDLKEFRTEVKDQLATGARTFSQLGADVAAIDARCHERGLNCPGRPEGRARRIAKKPVVLGGSILALISTLLALVWDIISRRS